MPLLEFWRNSRETVETMKVERIVQIAGDGALRDGSETSREFREFLTLIDSEKLAEFATDCLEKPFQSSGQVLQDIVNEIGQRLGFRVEWGRYQGVKNEIGFDGIWFSNNKAIVIEVKTTDSYTINIEKIAKYRDRLIDENRIPRDSSILLVLGREDTDDSSPIEAQVRGSRHAWTMRIVGVEALVKLMDINLSTQSTEVLEKIHTILQPFEYTRIDKIVDVVFTTAEDIERERVDEPSIREGDATPSVAREVRTLDKTPQKEIEEKKFQLIERLGTREGVTLQKRRYSMFSDKEDRVHAVVAISKKYDDPERYWYAYHAEPQRPFLREGKAGFMIFGMADRDKAFAVPYQFLETHWNDIDSTIRENGKEYKHIRIFVRDGDLLMRLDKSKGFVSLQPFII